jgi:hypothetical protein
MYARGRTFLTLAALVLLVAGCATRPAPSRPGWRVVGGDARPSLVYGRPGAAIEFAVVCDTDAGIADLVYPVDAGVAFAPGLRPELIVAADEDTDALPAELRATPGGARVLVARTRLPPAPVAEWAGKTITVGAAGRATTLTVRPDRRTLAAFLAACRVRA